MSAFIPVAPDRWAEMVQASAEVGPLRNKVSDLSTQLELRQVEIARLTSEIDRLRKAGDNLAVAWARVRTDYHTWDVAVKAWDAAKEGGAK